MCEPLVVFILGVVSERASSLPSFHLVNQITPGALLLGNPVNLQVQNRIPSHLTLPCAHPAPTTCLLSCRALTHLGPCRLWAILGRYSVLHTLYHNKKGMNQVSTVYAIFLSKYVHIFIWGIFKCRFKLWTVWFNF